MAEKMRVLFMVTGASRGLGRSIAKAFCRDSAPGESIHAVLVDHDCLDATERAIASKSVKVTKHQVDLRPEETIDETIKHVFKNIDSVNYDFCFLINFAGYIGHLSPRIIEPSLAEMKRKIDLQASINFWVSARFAYLADNVTIVNFASLAAYNVDSTKEEYTDTMGARRQYKIARENWYTKFPAGTVMKIITYAPGALATSSEEFLQPQEPGQAKLVHPDDSAHALVKLLQYGKYECDEYIDYYDLIDV
jgi:NAD(P)-dependent dehydrogenase (short-subunit alcohol dehydrogenase family)